MGRDWALRGRAAVGFLEHDRCGYIGAIPDRGVRGRLLRIPGYGHGPSSTDVALLRDVRSAAHAAAWCATAVEYSYQDWLQAGEVSDGSEGYERFGQGWVLGRPGVFVFLWAVRKRLLIFDC